MGNSRVLSFRVDEKTKRKLEKLAEFWNLKERELARKIFLDGLTEFTKTTRELVGARLAEGKITKKQAEELLSDGP